MLTRTFAKCMMPIMHWAGNGMVTKMKQEIEELHIKRKGE